jgi:hypothetical protein
MRDGQVIVRFWDLKKVKDAPCTTYVLYNTDLPSLAA